MIFAVFLLRAAGISDVRRAVWPTYVAHDSSLGGYRRPLWPQVPQEQNTPGYLAPGPTAVAVSCSYAHSNIAQFGVPTCIVSEPAPS